MITAAAVAPSMNFSNRSSEALAGVALVAMAPIHSADTASRLVARALRVEEKRGMALVLVMSEDHASSVASFGPDRQ